MDFAELITATTLLLASSNQSPLHEFEYSFYDENSQIQTESGSNFYDPKFPEFTIQGLTHIENTGLIWTIKTPFISSKYRRGVNLEGTIYRDYSIGRNTRIRLSGTFMTFSKEKNLPCEDSTGRLFHCYHGTQPTSDYFIYPYEKVNNMIYRHRRTFHFTEMRLAYIWIF